MRTFNSQIPKITALSSTLRLTREAHINFSIIIINSRQSIRLCTRNRSEWLFTSDRVSFSTAWICAERATRSNRDPFSAWNERAISLESPSGRRETHVRSRTMRPKRGVHRDTYPRYVNRRGGGQNKSAIASAFNFSSAYDNT